jgi:23S rRNA pseudouridine1911/1915/1917 synthase
MVGAEHAAGLAFGNGGNSPRRVRARRPAAAPPDHAPLMDSTVYLVPATDRPARADKILARAFPAHSRTALQRAFEARLVRRNGVAIGQSDEVQPGDRLEFALPAVQPAELRPVAIPLEILYEDGHMLALNKPAGMVVHPGAGTGDDTLVHALLAHCAGGLSGVGGIERPGIVHRLDKETSGVLLVAKTDAAHRGLSEQFAGRHLRKEYLALVAGVPRLQSGVIERSISRHPVHRERMTTGEGGRPARTDWAVIETFGSTAALLRCRIHSGRTHQIRVHLKSIGHPLLGDKTYGWRPDPTRPAAPRVMLHSERIAFLHPITARPMDLRAPLPRDFADQLAVLRRG